MTSVHVSFRLAKVSDAHPTHFKVMVDVCLVLMPYADVERPSIALGLLKASLQERGIETTAIYPNIWFAEKIGLDVYQNFSSSEPTYLAGEWTFAGAAFPEFQPKSSEYFQLLLNYGESLDSLQQGFAWVREQAPAFVERVAQHILKGQPRIVACSSMFQQHCASLALLRRIRELNPEIVTIMGGANCEGAMGQATLREFPWLDFVCSGEGDEMLYQLCRKLLDRGRNLAPEELPYGVIGRSQVSQGTFQLEAPRASISNLDDLPIPDYDDYFQTLSHSSLAPFIEPGLPIETSRGCWWGQKSQCTFCGLNGEGMTYRSKSPERVIREFAELSQRYGLQKFEVVDNILDLNHINTVLPVFEGLPQPYAIFYETKANLKREQLQQLAAAGVCWLQPGIESLDDSVLKLFKKGNSTAINVQFLKWSRELGIRLSWNLLTGVPGESKTWYQEVLAWLPLIVHLQPPGFAAPLRYDRFSPYHEHPEDWGLKLSPKPTYFYVYPLSPEAMSDLAYFFEDRAAQSQEYSNTRKSLLFSYPQWQESGESALQKWTIQWINLFWSKNPPILSMVDEGERLQILDTRPCAIASQHSLSGLAYWVYLTCDGALTAKEILLNLQGKYQLTLSWDEVEPIVRELCQRRIMLELNGRYLSLALKAPIPPLPTSREAPSGYIDLRRFQSHLEERRKVSEAWDYVVV
jgi:magnesium-protoporphyrin IX monomethyl ester (oxidative) cyclase